VPVTVFKNYKHKYACIYNDTLYTVYVHRESKNMPPNICSYLRQILTGSKNYFSGALCGKFILLLLYYYAIIEYPTTP